MARSTIPKEVTTDNVSAYAENMGGLFCVHVSLTWARSAPAILRAIKFFVASECSQSRLIIFLWKNAA